jgi:uncharacterized membrane protein
MPTSSALKTQKWHDLAALLILPALWFLIIHFLPLSVARIVGGWVFVLFAPGYAVLAALFPHASVLDIPSRFGLSLGVSVALSILIGFLLNYSPWGIQLETIFVSTYALVVLCCAVAFWRRSNLAPDDQIPANETFGSSDQHKAEWISKSFLLLLILSVIGILASLTYNGDWLKGGDEFTEFYLLGSSAKAGEYPHESVAGEPITLSIGVINHESADVQYRIEQAGSTGKEQIATLQLGHEEMWQQPYTFTLTQPGENQEVEFLLYKGDEEEPYRSLHLWITVREE